MVEVFKTSVECRIDAVILIEQIQNSFPDHKASFDLEDCDRVLRVKAVSELVQSAPIIKLLGKMGFDAEILPDETASMVQIMLFDRKFYPVFE